MIRLFLVRHGQSIWNLQNRFTGWVDVSLSDQGVLEAQQAAALLADEYFDITFTSALLRAQDSLITLRRLRIPDDKLEILHQSIMEGRTVVLMHCDSDDPEAWRQRLAWTEADPVFSMP